MSKRMLEKLADAIERNYYKKVEFLLSIRGMDASARLVVRRKLSFSPPNSAASKL
jgi:hypothetical protein